MTVRVFSLCRRENFRLFFGAFQTIPQAFRASRPYLKEAVSWCNFRLCAAVTFWQCSFFPQGLPSFKEGSCQPNG